MHDPQHNLLSKHLATLGEGLAADPGNEAIWSQITAAIAPTREAEPALASAVDAKDAAALRALCADWASGKTLLPESDRQLIRRAIKAFKKRIKVTRLDEESRIGGGAMSSGRRSSVVGITPPAPFGPEVWAELVRQGRLKDLRHGLFELVADLAGD